MAVKKYVVVLERPDDKTVLVVRARSVQDAERQAGKVASAWGYSIIDVVELEEWMAWKRSGG